MKSGCEQEVMTMRIVAAGLLAMTVLVVGTAPVFGQVEGYQQYFRYVSEYPLDNSDSGFVDEINGIAHDGDHWYITTSTGGNPSIWKIPVTQNLSNVHVGTPGVSMVRNDDVVCPTKYGPKNLQTQLKYTHYGDLVAYKHNDKYYLLVPIEKGIDGHAIAVFLWEEDKKLECLGYDIVKLNNDDPPWKNNSSAWCAVDKDGYVYTSPDKWSIPEWNGEAKLIKYSLNWNTFGSDPQYPVQLTYQGVIPLMKEDGSPLKSVEISGYPADISGSSQGGEFSPDYKLLYVSSGSCGYPCGEGMDDELGGIHVFETDGWRRVARSDKNTSFFLYDFTSGSPVYEEMEGLTIWDLEEQRASYLDPGLAPFIQGQLHVLLLQNNIPGFPDSLFLFHYTNTTYVDYSAYGFTPNGTIGRPFNTVGDALAFYNQNEYFAHGHWTGGRIKIHTGSYPEALTFSRRMQIVPWSGKAVVGTQGRFSLTPGGAININNGGVLKLY